MLGDLPAVDPVVDVYEVIGKVWVGLLDKVIVVIVYPLTFLIGGDDNVFVHELIQH